MRTTPLPTRCARFLHRSAPLLLALALVALALGAAAPATLASQSTTAGATKLEQAASRLPRTEHELPVVLTVSGGISLGAYQSGVNWGLLQFARQLRNGTPPVPASNRWPRASDGTPLRFRLAAAAGASAGNINALLSALEWCNDAPLAPPEESLFWQTWIRVGWEQLFPEPLRRRPADAVFTRAFFQDSIYGSIRQRMNATAHRPGCDVPVGLTLTRLEPEPYLLDPRAGPDGIQAPTQRFVATFRVHVSDGSDPASPAGTIRFVQSTPEVRRARALGLQLAVVPADGPRARADVLDDTLVFGLVEASSAFPVAFAPRVIHYYPTDSLNADGSCPIDRDTGRCARPMRRVFVDGGVFDNNPLDLALGLFARHGAGPRDSLGVFVPYINPGALRNGLRRSQARLAQNARQGRASRDTLDSGGLVALMDLASGALPSARQYELQTLFRRLAEPGAGQRPWISATTRGYPVVGEHLGAFASFLARPFREYDFYVGVYDALHFLAVEAMCGGVGQAPRGTASCHTIALERMLADTSLRLGPIATRVTRAIYEREYPGVRGRVPWNDSTGTLTGYDGGRLVLLEALVAAGGRLLDDTVAAHCNEDTFVSQRLCRDGLDVMLRNVATPAVVDTLAAWSDKERCTTAAAVAAGWPCAAARRMHALLARPDVQLERDLELVLRQSWRVERDRSARGGRHAEVVVDVAEAVFNWEQSTHRRQRGLNPSFVARTATRPARWMAVAVPNHVSAGVGIGGWEAGWRPAWFVSRHLALVAPASVIYRHVRRPGNGDRGIDLALGPGAMLRLGPFRLQAALQSVQPTSDIDVGRSGRLGGEYAVQAGIFRIAARSGPAHFNDRHAWYQRPAWTVGLAEVNGLAYWTARIMK